MFKENKIIPYWKGKKLTYDVWNKGKKGLQVPWNKGLTVDSDPRVKKYVEANIGKVMPKEQREQIRAKLTGFKHNEEARQNMSMAQKTKAWNSEERREKARLRLIGRPSAMQGKKHSEETRAKMREAHKRRGTQL
jgi:hypothetical protein